MGEVMYNIDTQKLIDRVYGLRHIGFIGDTIHFLDSWNDFHNEEQCASLEGRCFFNDILGKGNSAR